MADDHLRMAPARLQMLRRMAYANAQAVVRLETKLRKVEARLAANVPRIAFGTGKLFRQQHHLPLTSHADHEAWRHRCRHDAAFVLQPKWQDDVRTSAIGRRYIHTYSPVTSFAPGTLLSHVATSQNSRHRPFSRPGGPARTKRRPCSVTPVRVSELKDMTGGLTR